MRSKLLVLLSLIVFTASPASAWDIPPDNGTMGQAAINEILAANDYPETSTYKQAVEFIDFSANGQNFTQVVVTLTPEKPRMRNGKKLVVVGGEPGSEYAMDFVTTVEGKEGPAVWLAKRGITFVALTRVGRWNFLAPTKDGSWETVPLGSRMPMFNRAQKAHWAQADYEVKRSGLSGSQAAGVSAVYRFPKKGTALEKQMLAATPRIFIEGYRRALEKAIPDRRGSFVLFWGMSTGGASLYPLAKYYTPDGYLGWGTSSTGLAYVNSRALAGNFNDVYEHSALRVRERGLDDFEFYTRNIDPKTRALWWKAALKDPRFKSTEDAAMQFGAAALTEQGLRLWQSDFLPAEDRRVGFAAFMQAMFEPSYPPAELKTVPVLDLNGTNDEPLPPATVDANRKVMEPYARKYRVGRIEGLHHYLFTQDSIKIVGSTWMRYIESGYFD
jgi:pimeloyl-ACP methyl ester carboxylesterase